VATTTLLASDLYDALIKDGRGGYAARIVDLIPYPAGRDHLIKAVESGTVGLFFGRWIEDVARDLRCLVLDAAEVRDLLNGVER
jgi:hypothetical protein